MISKTQMIVAGVALLALACIKPIAFLLGVVVLCVYLLFVMHDAPAPSAPVVEPPPVIEPSAEHVEPEPFHHPPRELYVEPVPGEPSYGAIPRWVAQSKTLAERVADLIAAQATMLSAIYRGGKCRDVLLTDDQACLVTTANSAINRHGTLIEDVILQTLKDCDRYRVWKSRKLATDEASDDDGGHRKMDVDLVVFDTKTHCVTGYEVKRNSANAQDVERKLDAALPLLIREAETAGYTAIKADVAVVSWYGGLHSHKLDVVTRETIDERFGRPIRKEVERATDKLRAELQGLFTHVANDRRAA